MIGGICMLCVVFFFKQKTAYEMRISDWSSDVCSSDLRPDPLDDALGGALGRRKPDGQAFGDAPGEEGTLGVGLEGPDGVEQGDRFLRQLHEERYARLDPVELRGGRGDRKSVG